MTEEQAPADDSAAATETLAPAVSTTATGVAERTDTTTSSKTSASARLAARREAARKAQQRGPVAMITAEHFAYVRRELIVIATLAITFFALIIIAYFLFGRTA